MYLTEVILGLRKLGIGRSLSASEIVKGIDEFLFTETDWSFEGYLLFDEDNYSMLLPLLPDNHPDQEEEYFFEIKEIFPELQRWCHGFEIRNVDDELELPQDELNELSQFDAINSFLLMDEVLKYLLTTDDCDDDENEVRARSAVANISPKFRVASGYFNRALDNPNETGHLLLEDWANNGTYIFKDGDCDELTKKFCEVSIWLSSYLEKNEFYIPSDLPLWNENIDFLNELKLLDQPSWSSLAFKSREISDIRFFQYIQDDITRWLRIFNHYYLPSRWAYYFWESPLDASVWADSGFEPVEAALWKSIGYDTFDALAAHENEWLYNSIAPMVRAGMSITDEIIELWGNALNSSEILDAVDRGFPNIKEYQKYKSVDSDYSTIQRFKDVSMELLTIQELSRAIALEKSWMDMKDAVAWSKLDQPLSAVVEFKLANQTPLQASKWIGCGIPLSTALEWVALGVSQKDAMIWIEHDVDINLAKWFLEHSIDSPREGKLWLKYIPKKEIPTWKAAEFDPISASDWREIGFGPKTSLEWIAQGVNSAQEAGEWLKNKFELKEAIQWLGLSISAENAKKWRDKGVSPDIAQRREQAGIKP